MPGHKKQKYEYVGDQNVRDSHLETEPFCTTTGAYVRGSKDFANGYSRKANPWSGTIGWRNRKLYTAWARGWEYGKSKAQIQPEKVTRKIEV